MTFMESAPQAKSQVSLQKDHSHIGATVLTFTLFLAVLSYITYYVIFDSQNSVLQVLGISNVGQQLELAKQDEDEHYSRFNAINSDIDALEKNSEIQQQKNTIAAIKERRIMWTEALDKLKTVIAGVPQDFIDDIVITNYSGDAVSQEIAIDVKLKNEKVFTLNANLVDALSDFPDFYDVEFKDYSRSENSVESTNSDYETQAHITFKYRRSQETVE